MLDSESKRRLLRTFPDVKLSYDRLLHKKVSADLYFVIPKGPKAFIWITHFDRRNVALVLMLDAKGSIRKIEPVVLAFNDRLALGTVLYGSLMNVESESMDCKLERLVRVFELTKRSARAGIVLGSPVIESDYGRAFEQVASLPYRVYGIQAHFSRGRNGPIGTHPIRVAPSLTALFRVKATLESDIYELFCLSHGKEVAYGIAMIPTYKHSVCMNNEFRRIKENGNLDLLEESDDEEEFENVSVDKFVDLEKSLVMQCVYMPKFRKWCPEKIVDTAKLSDRRDIVALEKK
jgi:hypothetical protein